MADMKWLRNVWSEDDGGLSFEWVLLVTLLTIGIVGGLSAARDAIIDELGDVAQSAIALDQSYRVDGAPDMVIHQEPDCQGGTSSQFTDAGDFQDCERMNVENEQGVENDGESP
jgi:Flp pilus assembly pilin Flp